MRRFLILIVILSIAVSSFFAFGFEHPVAADAIEYDNIAWNLTNGRGFSSSISTPYLPTMYREPLYPMLLSLIYFLFGHNVIAVKIFQIIIYALSCILLFFLVSDIAGKRIAVVSSFIFSVFPTSANYPSYLISETIFTFLLIAFILILLKAISKNKLNLFFYAGVLWGGSTLCKVVMLLFFIPLLFIFIMKYKNKFSKYFFTFLLAGTLVILPWLLRNYFVFKSFSLTLRGGTQLLYRAEKLNDNTEKIKATAVYSVSERLGKKMYPYFVEDPAEFLDKDLQMLYKQEEELRQKGYTYAEIDKMSMKNAISQILKKPLLYLMQSSIEFIKLTAFTHIPLLNETYIIKQFDTFKNGPIVLSSIRGIFRIMAYFLLALTIAGMWFNRKQWTGWGLLTFLIIYINVIHSLLFACARYAVPLIPFYLIFSLSAIVRVIKKLKIPTLL